MARLGRAQPFSPIIRQNRQVILRGIDGDVAGPFFPLVMVNDAGVGAIAWSTPENAGLSDNAYATAITVVQDTQRLNLTGFNLQLDIYKCIEGILLEVEAKVLVGTATIYCRAIKGGVISSTALSGIWTTSEGFVAYGGSTNLWGESWMPSDLNSNDFGFSIRQEDALTSTLSCDSARVTIYNSIILPGAHF
jgi:hypothetical protein